MGFLTCVIAVIALVVILVADEEEIGCRRMRSGYRFFSSEDFPRWTCGSIVTLLLCLGCFLYFNQKPHMKEWPPTTYQLVAMSNGQSVQGSFFLGCSDFSGADTIKYAYLPDKNKPDTIQLSSVKANQYAFIIQKNDVVPHVTITVMADNFWLRNLRTKYEFYVPKGSVVLLYKIDVSK
jgi:hypothetical protein